MIACVMVFTLTIPIMATSVQPRIDFAVSIKIVAFEGDGILSSVGYGGHVFLIVTNRLNYEITIGHFPVGAGESITIGTFGDRSAHTGIWYNIEGCLGVLSDCTTYALATALTVTELKAVNNKINELDDWSITENCSYFAVNVWNATPTSQTVSGWNPAAVVSSIKSYDGYLTNPTLPTNSDSDIARHTSDSYVFDTSGKSAG